MAYLTNPKSFCYRWHRNYIPPWESMSSFPKESLAGLLTKYVNRQSYIFIAQWGSDLFLNETQTDCSYQIQLVSEALP